MKKYTTYESQQTPEFKAIIRRENNIRINAETLGQAIHAVPLDVTPEQVVDALRRRGLPVAPI